MLTLNAGVPTKPCLRLKWGSACQRAPGSHWEGRACSSPCFEPLARRTLKGQLLLISYPLVPKGNCHCLQ